MEKLDKMAPDVLCLQRHIAFAIRERSIFDNLFQDYAPKCKRSAGRREGEPLRHNVACSLSNFGKNALRSRSNLLKMNELFVPKGAWDKFSANQT